MRVCSEKNVDNDFVQWANDFDISYFDDNWFQTHFVFVNDWCYWFPFHNSEDEE